MERSYTAQDFCDEPNVSRETFEAFTIWHNLLLKWNRRINLVSPAAVENYWLRHALDSWQITEFLTEGDIEVLDLGSGAGFPGLAIAIALKERGTGHVTLVESAGKKANFLRTVIRDLALPAQVWANRAEKLPSKPYSLITARAFAPLPRLLSYAQPFWGSKTKAVLLKGETVSEELTEARKYWTFDSRETQSQSDMSARILHIQDLASRT